ncbi:TonB-dependent receptor [candidate division WOR-3 bacterium]|nr:TonB-dependent receptor [candidate division WOR-3 bacterium]
MKEPRAEPLHGKERFFIFKYVLITVLFFPAASFCASLTGTVRDAYDLCPVATVSVFIDGRLAALTDANGRYYVIGIQTGEHTVLFQRLGFEKLEENFFLEHAETREYSVNMIPSDLSAEGVTVWGASRAFQNYEVLREEDIEKFGKKDIPEILECLSGVTVHRQNEGGFSKIILSGPSAGRISVYIDGVKVNDPASGAYDLSAIPLSAVKSIVVVNNPSAAEEPGGRIMIYLKEPGSGENEISLAKGSWGKIYAGTRLGVNGFVFPSLNFSLDLFHREYGGGYEAEGYPGNRLLNSDSRSSGAVLRTAFGTPVFAEISAAGDIAERGIPGQADGALMTLSRLESENILIWSRISRSFTGKFLYASYSFSYIKSVYNCPEYQPVPGQNDSVRFFPEMTETHTANEEVTLFCSMRFTGDFEMHLKSSLSRQKYMNEDLLRPFTEKTSAERKDARFAAGLSSQISLGRSAVRIEAEMSPILRDRNRAFISYSFGFSVSNRKEDFWASAGLTYSLNMHFPDFSQTHAAENVYSAGNPDLLPEISGTAGANFNMSGEKPFGWSLSTSAFFSILEEMIVWRRDFMGRYRPINMARAEGTGFDASFKADLTENIFIGSGISLQNVVNRTKGDINYGNQITYSPRYRFTARTGVIFGSLRAGIEFRSVARRFTREANTDPINYSRTSLEPYRNVEIFASYSVKSGQFDAVFGFSVKNIFDDRYMIVEQMPVEGRILSMEVKVKW